MSGLWASQEGITAPPGSGCVSGQHLRGSGLSPALLTCCRSAKGTGSLASTWCGWFVRDGSRGSFFQCVRLLLSMARRVLPGESSQHQGHAKTWQHPEDGCCTPRHWHPQGRKGEHCCCTHSIQPSALPAAEDQRASSSPTEAALKQEQSHPAPHHLPQGLAEHRSPLSWPLLPALPWPFPVQAAPSPSSLRPSSPSTGRVHSPGHTPGTCQGTHTAGKGLWAPQGEVQVSPVLPGPVHVLVLLHALGIRC